MKKRVLAVLLAVCMIVGTCVLFASAKTDDGKAETYAQKGDTFKYETSFKSLHYGDLKDTSKAKKADSKSTIEHTIKAKNNPTLSVSATTITKENIEGLLDFTPGFDEDVFDITTNPTKFGPDTDTISVTVTVKNEKQYMWVIDRDLADKVDGNVVTDMKDEPLNQTTDFSAKEMNTIKDGDSKFSITVKVSNIDRVENLVNLKLGLRFYGDNTYANLNADEIAIIKAKVNRYDVENEKGYTTYANTIYDLSDLDTVTLTTYLKDANEAKFYQFYGWVDSSGKIFRKAKDCDKFTDANGVVQYTWKCKSTDGAVYAAYVEIVDRHVITYSCSGEGDFRAFTDDREIAKIGGGEKGVVSVMDGRDTTFTFVPKEGWEVGKVVVDGKNITSFASIDFSSASSLVSTIRAIIDATYKDEIDGQQASGSYTFKSVKTDHSIEVVFVKSNPIEAPSGKELPTVEAEGITLATGAADENGEGGNGGSGDSATTVPAENGAAGSGGSAESGIVNPATGSTGAIAVFAVLSVAAGAAFVTAKKKED